MTAPRIISAAVARALLEDATPGPWAVDERRACAGVVSPALARSPGLGRDYEGVIAYWSPPPGVTLDFMYPRWSHERPGDMLLIAAAPDLAASVVALHALLDEAYDIIVSQRNPAWDDWCDRMCNIDLEVTP